jgi:hypothetical protein
MLEVSAVWVMQYYCNEIGDYIMVLCLNTQNGFVLRCDYFVEEFMPLHKSGYKCSLLRRNIPVFCRRSVTADSCRVHNHCEGPHTREALDNQLSRHSPQLSTRKLSRLLEVMSLFYQFWICSVTFGTN